MAFTWESSCLDLLRALIGDLDETPTYDNDRLLKVLIVAAFQVNQEVSFAQTFKVDLSDLTILPDPTAETTLDNNFVNLMCLKAACIMDRGKATIAAGKAVAGKDMSAVSFDLTGVAASTLALIKQGWCAVYKEAIWDYVSGSGNLGKTVMGPFRTYARYNGRFGYGNTLGCR